MSDASGEGTGRTARAVGLLQVFMAMLVVLLLLSTYMVYRALMTGRVATGHGEAVWVGESPFFYWIIVACVIFMIPAALYAMNRCWIQIRELKSGVATLEPPDPQHAPKPHWIAYLTKPQAYRSRSTRIALAVLGLSVAFIVPLCIADLTGHPFLLSSEWLGSSWPLCVFFGVVNIIAVYKIIKAAKVPASGYRTKLSMLIVSGVACLLGMNAISGVTLLYVAITGSETELPLAVMEPDSSNGHCSSAVRISSLWLLTNSLCGFPPDIRRSLQPGDPLTVIGRGNAFGVFARQVRIEDRYRLRGSLRSGKG